MMESEELQAELERLQIDNVLMDQNLIKFFQRVQEEEESLVIVNSLIYLSQFIDYKSKSKKGNSPSKKNMKKTFIPESQEKVVANIDRLFEKENIDVIIDSDSKEREQTEEAVQADDEDSAQKKDRFWRQLARKSSKRNPKNLYSLKGQTRSFIQGKDLFSPSGVKEQIDQFFEENPNGPDAVAEKIIVSYKQLVQESIFHGSNVDCLLMNFKERSEMGVTLEKFSKDQKKLYLAHENHSKLFINPRD